MSVPDEPDELPDPEPEFVDMDDEDLSQARQRFIFESPAVFQPVYRQDIVGIDYIIDELDDCINYLRNFEAVDARGAQLNSGVLFVGPSGAGKTFTARYLATIASARFINMAKFPRRQSKFTAADISGLFRLSREYVEKHNKPILIFCDEFDAYVYAEGDAVKLDVVTRLKEELSGMTGKARGVFLVAATNKPNLIPEDLTRRGRLGNIITFKPLSRKSKRLLLEHFILKHPHEDRIDFDSLSFLVTADFAPDIEETVEAAWLRACLKALKSEQSEPKLSDENLLITFLKALRGVPDSFELDDRSLWCIALYEVGRAFVARTMRQPTQVIALTRMGYKDAERVVKFDEPSSHQPISAIRDQIAICFGGKVAQELCAVEPNLKYISDFEVATALAQAVVERFRNADSELSIAALAKSRAEQTLPPALSVAENVMYSTTTAIEQLLANQCERAKKTLEHYGKGRLEAAARDLIERGYLLQMHIDARLDDGFVPGESVEPSKPSFPTGFRPSCSKE